MLVTFAALNVFVLVLLAKISPVVIDNMLKDKLTGAYNKRYFEKFILSEMKSARKNGTSLSILMLDLDHFKKVNDTYGHGFGDTVLKSLSMTLKDCLEEVIVSCVTEEKNL